jgi:hypothetical protein
MSGLPRRAADKQTSANFASVPMSKRLTVIGVRIDASGYVAQFNALREL